ncbi:hypothetical protein PHLCEN_2v8902 [Hermanssonia centrifuga]|uniref:Ketopantoate reductase C-terminal domain-containing protein n=1 Tax=Hermanssonia centrifuga TaxID=98765 RepID=A0A2R6NSC5_9APHY|nr:hypothetical protein PHLCEN_2v8902 [Hermanssonia centrifuga]
MQNGLGVERDLYDALKKINGSEEPRIISTAVWIGTRMLNKNTVEHNEFDRVSMGVYRPDSTTVTNTTAETALLTEFADILKAGGSDVIVVPEIQRIKYSKNLWNCVFGTTAAISRCALPTVFRSPHMDPGSSNSEPLPSTTTTSVDDGRSPSQLATAEVPSRTSIIKENTIPFIYDALTEMYTLGLKLFPASEAGPGLDPDIVSNTLKTTAALHTRTDSTHRPSMLVDVEMGRPMELDVVVGEVVRMGRKMEVQMPVCDI